MGGVIFGWRATHLVLFRYLKTLLLFLLFFVIDGIMSWILMLRWFPLIFTVKVTALLTSWPIWVIALKVRSDWTHWPPPFTLISSVIDVACQTTDFPSLRFLIFFLFFCFWGFWPSPPSCNYFSPFFNKIFWVRRHRMDVSRGANLVGMSLFPLDVCPTPGLPKKNTIINVIVT